MKEDRERLKEKSTKLTWEQFEQRIDSIFNSIQSLIEETNDTKND
jgi:hypothetical protein